MNKKFIRALSILLSALLLVTEIPITASAEEYQGDGGGMNLRPGENGPAVDVAAFVGLMADVVSIPVSELPASRNGYASVEVWMSEEASKSNLSSFTLWTGNYAPGMCLINTTDPASKVNPDPAQERARVDSLMSEAYATLGVSVYSPEGKARERLEWHKAEPLSSWGGSKQKKAALVTSTEDVALFMKDNCLDANKKAMWGALYDQVKNKKYSDVVYACIYYYVTAAYPETWSQADNRVVELNFVDGVFTRTALILETSPTFSKSWDVNSVDGLIEYELANFNEGGKNGFLLWGTIPEDGLATVSATEAYTYYGWLPSGRAVCMTSRNTIADVDSSENKYYTGRTYCTGLEDINIKPGFYVEGTPKDANVVLGITSVNGALIVKLTGSVDALNKRGYNIKNTGNTIQITWSNHSNNCIKGYTQKALPNTPNLKLLTVTKKQLEEYLSGEPLLELAGSLAVPTDTNAFGYCGKFTVTINGKSVQALESDESKGYHKVGTYTGANYCSWKINDQEKWQIHSPFNPDAYAEIVANEVGNSDWDTFSGIPSTENVSVAAGGTAYLVDAAGVYQYIGKPAVLTPGVTTDVIANANANLSTGIIPGYSPLTKRTITFKVEVTNWWGEDNPPCALNCPGHTQSIDGNGTVNQACDICGSKAKYKCKKCEQLFATNTGTHYKNGVRCPGDDWDDSGKCGCGGISLTVNCATGEVSAPGCAVTKNLTSERVNGQRYGGSVTATKGSKSVTVTLEDGLIDDGYTTGTGCTHSPTTPNMVHPGALTYTYTITETVDYYGYRDILTARLSALEKSYIKEWDENIYNIEGEQSSTNCYMTAAMWRGGSSNEWVPGSGRLYFQDFSNGTYSAGNSWAESAVSGESPTSPDYQVGNATVTITLHTDHKVGETGDEGKLDDYPDSSAKRGWSDGSYGGATSSDTTYESGEYPGDISTTDKMEKQALHAVNAWQRNNRGDYWLRVVGDNISYGVGDTGQTILADEEYFSAIPLFNTPFSTSLTSYQRHYINSIQDVEAYRAKMRNNGFDIAPADPSNPATLLKTGYLGTPSVTEFGNQNGVPYNAIYTLQLPNNTCYKQEVTDLSKEKEYGLFKKEIMSEGGSGGTSFEGYHATHSYPNKVSATIKSDTPVSATNFGTGNAGAYGVALVMSDLHLNPTAINGVKSDSMQVYNVYENMLEVTIGDPGKEAYNDTDTGVYGSGGLPYKAWITQRELTKEYKCKYSDGYMNMDGDEGCINDILIHTPVSTENWLIVGNGFTRDEVGIKDESGEDARTSTKYTAEADKYNYLVVGNTFHLWVSDFGDFEDENGTIREFGLTQSRGNGHTGSNLAGYKSNNKKTGESIPGKKGYTADMDTGCWVKTRYVTFPFPVAATNANGKYQVYPANEQIDLSIVRCTAPSGDKRVSGFITADSEKNNAVIKENPGSSSGRLFYYSKALADSGIDNMSDKDGTTYDVHYGLDYEFIILPSANEAKATDDSFDWASKITYKSVAINSDMWGAIATTTESTNKERSDAYTALAIACKEQKVDVVGRLGNLALEDVGDFRFSNLFKDVVEGEWLMPGVIQKVNVATPNMIVATPNDILGDEADDGTQYGHATYSATAYLVGDVDSSMYKPRGKAGKWVTLPLTAAINPVEEYRDQQMRLGYQAFFDIETIGNYYGLNVDSNNNINRGPESPADSVDTRKYVMTIIPHYYLYDPDINKWYAVDLYSGKAGNYNVFWNGRTDTTLDLAALYIDMDNEADRRNVSELEKALTDLVVRFDEAFTASSCRVSALTDVDYIGTPSKIVLDAYDRNYIGTYVEHGNLLLPSSYVRKDNLNSLRNKVVLKGSSGVYKNLVDGSSSYSILNGAKWNDEKKVYEVSKGYVDSIQFAQQQQRWYFTLGTPSSTIVVPHSNSTLNQKEILTKSKDFERDHPNAVLVCMGEIGVKGLVWELEYSAKMNGMDNKNIPLTKKPGSENPKIPDVPTKPEGGTPGEIDPDWPILIVYDPWETSADDLDTYGTH